MSKTLVLGGMSSGKSEFAERHVVTADSPVCYIATAQVSLEGEQPDASWLARIEQHKRRRPKHWVCVEEPIYLANAIHQYQTHCLLIDCLGVWLANLLLTNDETMLRQELDAFTEAVQHVTSRIYMVSTESGLGVIPMDAMSRRYCDELGKIHQRLAAVCDRVVLVVAGLPNYIKGDRL